MEGFFRRKFRRNQLMMPDVEQICQPMNEIIFMGTKGAIGIDQGPELFHNREDFIPGELSVDLLGEGPDIHGFFPDSIRLTDHLIRFVIPEVECCFENSDQYLFFFGGKVVIGVGNFQQEDTGGDDMFRDAGFWEFAHCFLLRGIQDFF